MSTLRHPPLDAERITAGLWRLRARIDNLDPWMPQSWKYTTQAVSEWWQERLAENPALEQAYNRGRVVTRRAQKRKQREQQQAEETE